MNDELVKQIADWVEFFRDLGFDGFYRGPELEALVRSWVPDPSAAPIQDAEPHPPADAARTWVEEPTTATLAALPVQPQAARVPYSLEADLKIVPPRSSAARSMSLFEAEAPAPPLPGPETLDQIRSDLGDCHRCKLASGRKHIVFGQGNPKAELVFVGEGPGADEDEQGLPFVGRAGQLLNRMLQRVDIRREDVYICNVVKCRPPGNRTPEKDEVETCSPFLLRQIQAIQPRLICCLGIPATRTVLGIKEGITRIHGRFYDYRGTKAMATVHPAYVLRNPREERILLEDFEKIRDFLKAR